MPCPPLLSQTPWDNFGEVIRFFGLPGAVFLGLTYAIWKGWIYTGREVEEKRADHVQLIADLRKQLADMKSERDEWRSLAWDNQRQLGMSIGGLASAADKIPPAPPTPNQGRERQS